MPWILTTVSRRTLAVAMCALVGVSARRAGGESPKQNVAIECLNETTVYGELMEYSRGHFLLRTRYGVLDIPQDRVKRILFGEKLARQPKPWTPTPAPASGEAGTARDIEPTFRYIIRALDPRDPEGQERFLNAAFALVDRVKRPELVAAALENRLLFIHDPQRPYAALVFALVLGKAGEYKRAESLMKSLRERRPEMAPLITRATKKLNDMKQAE